VNYGRRTCWVEHLKMKKILILVEGQTEKRFVKKLLIPHFNPLLISLITTIIITRKVNVGADYKGGIVSYQKLKKQVLSLLNDPSAIAVTTMFDLYRLPESFPRYADALGEADIYDRVKILEDGLSEDISHAQDKFIPYIQVFEFESILFSDPQKIEYSFPDSASQIKKLVEIRDSFNSPEQINDENPPSKRILSLFPDYQKVASGSIIASNIGLETIRKECPHFDEWITKLEALSEQT